MHSPDDFDADSIVGRVGPLRSDARFNKASTETVRLQRLPERVPRIHSSEARDRRGVWDLDVPRVDRGHGQRSSFESPDSNRPSRGTYFPQ